MSRLKACIIFRGQSRPPHMAVSCLDKLRSHVPHLAFHKMRTSDELLQPPNKNIVITEFYL